MEQHVIAAELSATGAQELLAATSSAHLAYSAEDASAYFQIPSDRVVEIGAQVTI